MMHIEPAPEPEDFDRRVRQPGLRCMSQQIGQVPNAPRGRGRPCKRLDGINTEADIPYDKFEKYWRHALDHMRDAYNEICAYTCFRITATATPTVDHMAPKSKYWQRVYEWDNYRLACLDINSKKENSEDVLDPFEVQDDWFYLELYGFQIIPNPDLDDADRKSQIQQTIDRLDLNNSRWRKEREKYARRFWNPEPESKIGLTVLQEDAPFVARELIRQNRLHPEDNNATT